MVPPTEPMAMGPAPGPAGQDPDVGLAEDDEADDDVDVTARFRAPGSRSRGSVDLKAPMAAAAPSYPLEVGHDDSVAGDRG